MTTTEFIGRDLQKLIDHLPVVVFEYTFFPEGGSDFTYISPRSEELLGIRPEAILEGNLMMDNFIHPEDRIDFRQSVEQSVRTQSDWSWKGRCKGKSGFLWIETRSSPTLMEDGRIIYHGVISDISEQKRLESEHRITEARYRNLVEQLPLGIVVHTGGKIRFANEHAAKVIGASSPQELIGMEALRFVRPDLRTRTVERIEKILRGESLEPNETTYIRLDGKEIVVESVGHPYNFEGEPAVQVIFADITERKNAEAGFLRAETLFVELFQNTPLAIVLLNEKSEVVQINKGFESLFGYSHEELKGRTLTEAIVPAELEKEGDEINSRITDNKVIRVETVRQSRSRQRVSVIIYGVPVVLQNEKIGIFGMYVDITERQKVEEELKIRNAELDNFVYKVSHDLRAPLSSVLGLAHLAAMPGNRDDLGDYVRLMGEKASQLDHFISDVLSHSKNLKMEILVDRVDIREIINKTFRDLNYLTGADQVKTNVSITGGDFFSDQWRVAEIFRNLISNAIKYRKVGQNGSELSVTADVHHDQSTIVVEDNGIGIETEHLPRIFEMFFRASNQSDGSGLGLYIVKNAIDKLGGSVTVESKPGNGTRFVIVLPNHVGK